MHRQVLEVSERVLGGEHHHTLASVYCLAYTLGISETYGEALSLYLSSPEPKCLIRHKNYSGDSNKIEHETERGTSGGTNETRADPSIDTRRSRHDRWVRIGRAHRPAEARYLRVTPGILEL